MLSRVAETIFWLGRYMERTNGMLQILRTNYISSQDGLNDFSWKPVLQTYGELKEEEIVKIEKDSRKVLEYFILDRENLASSYNNIRQSRENARAVQDHITKEVWQCLNDFYHFIRDPQFELQFETGDPVTTIDMLTRHGLLFTGTVKNTMTRGEGYAYLHIGKFLERALVTTDILSLNLDNLNENTTQKIESPALRYLLYSLLGYEIYIKTYNRNFNAQDVLDLVVYNNYFPHSLIYSLQQLNKYFERLRPDSLEENYSEVEFLVGKTMNAVKYSNLDMNHAETVSDFLHETRQQLIGLANCFGKYYFRNT